MMEIKPDFFGSEKVTELAQQLLGMELWVDGLHGQRRGIITETEAYAGVTDRASHAFGHRRTKRNETMYGEGGHLYMYRCYGIHWMLNVVTAGAGIPHAILIRGLKPMDPVGEWATVARGPGKLTHWLGIDGSFNGEPIGAGRFALKQGSNISAFIESSARIGIAYAGEDAHLPYRFYLRGEASVSRPLQPIYPKK